MRTTTIFAALAITAGLLLAACAKEKKDPSSTADPSSNATEPAGAKTAGSSAEVKPPEVAIGATRTEHLAGAAKSIADTKEYAVSLTVPDAVTAGKAATAKVTLTPKKGWKLNNEFPYSLKVQPPDGVSLVKATQDKGDAVKWEQKSAAEWAIVFTASSAGKKSFNGDFNFAVCTDATCNPYSQKLAFAVDVK